MTRDDSSHEVSCTLTAEQRSERSSDVRTSLVAHYSGYERVEDGLELRFDGTNEVLEALAQFTAAELQCCSFAEYAISVAPPYEQTLLTVTGEEGTRELFREGLVDQLEAAAASGTHP